MLPPIPKQDDCNILFAAIQGENNMDMNNVILLIETMIEWAKWIIVYLAATVAFLAVVIVVLTAVLYILKANNIKLSKIKL